MLCKRQLGKENKGFYGAICVIFEALQMAVQHS